MGHLDTVNAFTAAYNAQQWDKAASYLTDDFTLSNGAESEGKREFLEGAKVWFAGAPDYHVAVENPRVEGETVYGLMRGTGTQTKPLAFPGMPPIPATGKRFTITANLVSTMRGDKIASTTLSLTSPGLLAQLGVQPPA
jgi:predicted ester cyclase